MADCNEYSENEQALADMNAVVSFFMELSVYFRIGFDIESSLPEIGHIAGYLSECKEPQEITACLRRCYYERILTPLIKQDRFWGCASGTTNTN